MTLLEQAQPKPPLADLLRPTELSQVVGQQHLLAADRPLVRMVKSGRLHSLIFWGPPGCGKTTLAKILSHSVNAKLITLSAVLAGVKEIREAIAQAQQQLPRPTVLFVDEIHRFNKSQQDAFLPHLESGLISLIGATTENPSFALNNALLSRVKIYLLKSIDQQDLRDLLNRSLKHPELKSLSLTETQQNMLIQAADGDARRLLGLLEIVVDYLDAEQTTVDDATIALVCGGKLRRFDNHGDEFYQQISALHKSVRNSNPDATLYWLARMFDGGCDVNYVARRLVRMASEDIGNADPRALTICIDAWQSWERLGSPEGDLALAQAAVYLASCAKSNAVYAAFNTAQADVKQYGSLSVPSQLCNAPTQLMKQQGFSQGYQYDHDQADGIAYDQQCFPEAIGEKIYYQPGDRGLEKKIAEKLDFIRAQRAKATSKP